MPKPIMRIVGNNRRKESERKADTPGEWAHHRWIGCVAHKLINEERDGARARTKMSNGKGERSLIEAIENKGRYLRPKGRMEVDIEQRCC